MPQLFAIVSDRGVEIGFAAAIHPSDFSQANIKDKVRAAASTLFEQLPAPDSDVAKGLSESLQSSVWHFRYKTRQTPSDSGFPDLAAWLKFLKSPDGKKWAGGSISRYISAPKLDAPQVSIADVVRETAKIFELAPVVWTAPLGN
jgi:hypothetical protein